MLATDILFLLDTSSGVGLDNFNKMKQFLDKIVNSFDIDNLLTRVGVVTFDEEARYDIKLNAHNTEKELLEGIKQLSYGNGKATRIDKALLLAGKQGFAEENGARPGVNKVCTFTLPIYNWVKLVTNDLLLTTKFSISLSL